MTFTTMPTLLQVDMLALEESRIMLVYGLVKKFHLISIRVLFELNSNVHSTRHPKLRSCCKHSNSQTASTSYGLLEGCWKTIVSCFLRTEPLLKYQTTLKQHAHHNLLTLLQYNSTQPPSQFPHHKFTLISLPFTNGAFRTCIQ